VTLAPLPSPGAPGVTSRLERELVTPEGTVLPFELAGAGDRAVAFAIDVVLILTATALLVLVAVLLLASGAGKSVAGPVFFLGWFVLWQCYFAICELAWQGRTIGKRFSHLRVVERHGGRLTAGSIFARNLTRLVEVQIPLALVISPASFSAHLPPWATLGVHLWLFALAAFPLLNRDRLRLGDLVAGTAVVHAPRALLLPELARATRDDAAATEYAFSPQQLAIYGIYELQVLEEVLRRDRPDRREALRLVAEKVARKIGWAAEAPADPHRFLAAFYAAQRARLEQELLFGRRKERKNR
jgi:uncharacterized RDD family membrane protein YckC